MKKYLFTVIFINFFSVLFGQGDSLKLLYERVVKIEAFDMQFDTMTSKIAALEDSLNLYKTKVKDYETIETGVSLIKEFTTKPIMSLVKYGLLPIALLFFVLGILKKVKPDWYTVLIQRWIEKYEKVNLLKAQKDILVISSSEFPNEIFIKKLFDKKNFKKVTYCKPDEVDAKLKEKDSQVIFANNEDGKLNQEDLEKITASHKYSVLFYFGKSQSWDFRKYPKDNEPEFLSRMNLANSRSQIYGNLMSSLEYHDTLI